MSAMHSSMRLLSDPQQGNPERMKHPHTGTWYRWYLLLWIGLTYVEGGTVEVLGGQETGAFFALFTSLMVFHTVLHGISFRLMQARRWYPLYAVAQAILVLALSLVVQGGFVSLLFALSLLLALVIEAAVILEQPRLIALTACGYVSVLPVSILAASHHTWQWATLDLLRVLLFVGPLLLFVMGYLLLYAHERRAHERTQCLLAQAEDLTSFVQEEIERLETITGMSCVTEIAALQSTPVALHPHIRCMIAEGLSNIARHAQAHQVGVFTTVHRDLLTVEVRDDGIGFDPAHLPQGSGHYGLRGLCERAGLVGGSLEIVSAEGRGTTLRLHLPYQRNEEKR